MFFLCVHMDIWCGVCVCRGMCMGIALPLWMWSNLGVVFVLCDWNLRCCCICVLCVCVLCLHVCTCVCVCEWVSERKKKGVGVWVWGDHLHSSWYVYILWFVVWFVLCIAKIFLDTQCYAHAFVVCVCVCVCGILLCVYIQRIKNHMLTQACVVSCWMSVWDVRFCLQEWDALQTNKQNNIHNHTCTHNHTCRHTCTCTYMHTLYQNEVQWGGSFARCTACVSVVQCLCISSRRENICALCVSKSVCASEWLCMHARATYCVCIYHGWQEIRRHSGLSIYMSGWVGEWISEWEAVAYWSFCGSECKIPSLSIKEFQKNKICVFDSKKWVHKKWVCTRCTWVKTPLRRDVYIRLCIHTAMQSGQLHVHNAWTSQLICPGNFEHLFW